MTKLKSSGDDDGSKCSQLSVCKQILYTGGQLDTPAVNKSQQAFGSKIKNRKKV